MDPNHTPRPNHFLAHNYLMKLTLSLCSGSHTNWHGLDLRITLLKENKHELLTDFLNDTSFRWIIEKTFCHELKSKCNNLNRLRTRSHSVSKEKYSNIGVRDLSEPLYAQLMIKI